MPPSGGWQKGQSVICTGARQLAKAGGCLEVRAHWCGRERRWEVTMFGMEMLICEMMMVALHDMNMDMAHYVSTNTCAPVTCEI